MKARPVERIRSKADTTMRERFREALELLDRCDSVWDDRLAAIRAAQHGWPPSANLDPSTRGGGEHWCFEHERSTDACAAAGVLCDGELVSGGPADPVGEAATRRDVAYDHWELLDRSVRSLAVEAGRMAALLERYGTRLPTLAERRETLDNEPAVAARACENCARARNIHGEPLFQRGRAMVNLGEERALLCRWCQDWFHAVGELPTRKQCLAHAAGEVVAKPKRRAS